MYCKRPQLEQRRLFMGILNLWNVYPSLTIATV